jgi:ABC-type oligopeptide transport system substrate-binding subunit
MKGAQRGTAALVAAMIALTLAACAPDPAPPPTPTGFASEEEAFAAAEATYRAYVDALNQVNLADPATFEPVFSSLSGSALAASKKSLTELHADGYTLKGETRYTEAERSEADREDGTVALDICLDVTDVDVSDASGQSVVSPDRLNVQPLRVTFVSSQTSERMTVDSSQSSEDFVCG